MSLTRRTFVKRLAAALGAATTSLGAYPLTAHQKQSSPLTHRFAICNETFGDWPFERTFGVAAECGYQGIEIAPFTIANDVNTISASQRKEIRETAGQAGVEIVGLHWLLAKTQGLHLTSPDRDTRKRTADYLCALARFCADLGGKLLIFGSPQQRNLREGVRPEQGMQFAAEVFAEALPTLEQTDVTLALEPLSPRTTNFLSTAAEAVELIERVDSPRCRLILDCNAMSTESAPIAELIHRHRAHLTHFHANDPNRLGPGFGDLDFIPVFRALAEARYRGWISVEVFDYSPGPERIARQSIEYMRKCIKEVSGVRSG